MPERAGGQGGEAADTDSSFINPNQEPIVGRFSDLDNYTEAPVPVEQVAAENVEQPPRERPEKDAALEAQILRARMMRDDPAVRTAMRVVRSTPDIWREVRDVLARREELIARTQNPGERHRNFAPLLTGIALSERGRDVMNLAMDRAFAAQADWLKAEIRDDNSYVHELVVGSGPHSAIYNSARMAERPGHPGLVIEKEEYVGGQFAGPGASAFNLNSRTRPENIDLPNLPGTQGSLNPQKMGVMQQSDLTGLTYAPQDTLAMPVRMNHMMASRVMTGTEIVNVEINTEERAGLYKVNLKDAEGGETYEVFTDRIVFTSGLGESRALALSNRRTQRIIKQENELLAEGKRPQVVTAEQLIEMLGDPSNPFPLEGLSKVVVVGPKDSAKVVIEALIGQGPQLGNTVAQLDRIKEIVWVGQEARTKEEFERQERQRYRSIGLEFPREGQPDYYHRITPAPGRAVGLDRDEGGNIDLLYTDGSGRSTAAGDLIVLATGFADSTDEVLSSLRVTGRNLGPEDVIDNIEALATSPGSDIEFIDGYYLVVNGLTPSPKGVIVEYFVAGEGFKTPLTDFSYTVSEIAEARDGIVGAYVYNNGTSREQIRTQEGAIARKLRDQQIYFAGPAAKLSLSGREVEEAPVLETIPENTAALFRYAENTSRLARFLIEQDGPELPKDLVTTPMTADGNILPELDVVGGVLKEYKIDFDEHRPRQKVPYKAVTEDLLRFAVGERLFNTRVPDGTPDIELTLRHVGGESYRVTEAHNALLNSEYREMLRHVLADPIVQQMVERLTDKGVNSSQAATISIPFIDGQVDIEGIEGKPMRAKRVVVEAL